MFTRTFHPDRFLKAVQGTEPFAEYCRRRGLAMLAGEWQEGTMLRAWKAALQQLSTPAQAIVELELAQANELADCGGIDHLLAAAEGLLLPPDTLPTNAALTLWFLVHHPTLFHEVFLQHEIQEVACWEHARAPAVVAIGELEAASAALAEALRSFYQLREGTGRFCVVEAYRLNECICFLAQVADRLRFLDSFTESGQPATQRLRPALPVLFAYYPSDGTLLLKSRLRARDRVLELLRLFGECVLQVPLDERCLATAFHLDLLKIPFRPLPDADDMEAIRVKTLHLRYPAHAGRRQVKLETLTSDEPSALEQLLAAHVADAALLAQLQVSYAELQIRLRTAGRNRNHLIRLWPNRCSLNQTPLGERLRRCLVLWGLTHVG
jgi:hypothetical protein